MSSANNDHVAVENAIRSVGIDEHIADIKTLVNVMSNLSQNGIYTEVFNSDGNVSIYVRGVGTIYGNSLPLRVETIVGGYDPNKTQTDKFNKSLDKLNHSLKEGWCEYEHVEALNDDNEIDDIMQMFGDLQSLSSTGKLQSFSETIIRYNSTIQDPAHLMDLLRQRQKKKDLIIKKLAKYQLPN